MNTQDLVARGAELLGTILYANVATAHDDRPWKEHAGNRYRRCESRSLLVVLDRGDPLPKYSGEPDGVRDVLRFDA